jgi:hypothetical protein
MNRPSWNDIRIKAAAFADEWKDARYERGETQSFYNEFFEIFGVRRRQVATFEEPVKKLGNKQGFIDLFWKGTLLVEQKSAGRNLEAAKAQAMDYFPGLKPFELPRYILLCDFQNFELHDLETGDTVTFTLAELPAHVEAFGFILGIEKRIFRDQDPVNIAASEIMGRLHDSLKAAGYTGHDLERFLVRLLFCLFADDTGIFEPRDIFTTLITERTHEDGSDLGLWLSQLFDVLNEPEDKRLKNLDEDLRAFPYVNGDLFAERLRIPAFDAAMRQRLIEACAFNWDAISPAIFGALFQSVMERQERRAQGAHYTTERNILKVIRPLFLDDLRAEFGRICALQRGKKAALEAFQDRLAALRFFDPACGCGNFLVIAYRELRELELDVLRELNPNKQQVTDIAAVVKVNVHQFYGIEIGEFPARIAEVAMWMTDHIANNRVSLEFGQVFARIPLRHSPHIHHADALETDWASVLRPEECSFVLGNPPFIGSKLQSPAQRAQVQRVASLGGSGGTLDYVSAWFLKAGQYVNNLPIRIGFVTTNSITQGEQVAQLWPLLFDRYGLEIAFAHRTFAWGSDARGVAHVHVVIIGLVPRSEEPTTKRLFSYPNINGDPIESPCSKISPYLIEAGRLSDPHLVVREVSRPINGAPTIQSGSQPIEDGNYIFTTEEKDAFLAQEPRAEPFLRPYIGAVELINGSVRWILALQDAPPNDLRQMPQVLQRMENVRLFRSKSERKSTLAIANSPTQYNVTVLPQRPFLAIPEVSSEQRDYVPIAYLQPPTIPSNKLRILLDADLWQFGVLTSRMNTAWLRAIGGRMKSDFSYSIDVVYNNFPWPNATDAQREQVSQQAQAILDARAAFPTATLADLYDRLTMPPALRQAHTKLDTTIERLYRPQSFTDDAQRVEHLLGLYETLSAPLLAGTHQRARRRATARS